MTESGKGGDKETRSHMSHMEQFAKQVLDYGE